MDIHFKIAGVILMLLSVIHVKFPAYFNWAKELPLLSLINRQMMYVHTFFIAFVVFMMGLLCVTSSNELLNTALGKKVCLGFGAFWLLRLCIQFFGYSSALWKGKLFETAIHITFSLLWLYFSTIFLIAYFF